MKILYVDTETTGLSPTTNGLIQIAGAIEIDYEIKEYFNFKVNTFDADVLDQKALDVHGISAVEIKTFEDPYKVHNTLTKMFSKYVNKFDRNDKFTPIGYNVKFDLDFLSAWFKKCGDSYFGSWQNWRSIDILNLVNYLAFEGTIKAINHKLETICEYFEMPFQEEAHDALVDVKQTIKLFQKIRSVLNINN